MCWNKDKNTLLSGGMESYILCHDKRVGPNPIKTFSCHYKDVSKVVLLHEQN